MRILFIGNSHTFANGLPFQVRALLRHVFPGAEVSMLAAPGVTLGWHGGEPETQMAIRCHPWDYVVLQQKTHPFGGYRALQRHLSALRSHLEHSGARVLLFVTWVQQSHLEKQAVLDDAFARAAVHIGARAVPVARAWQVAARDSPGVALYDTDGENASPAGSYLAACAFYASILGQPPLGLPGRIEAGGQVLVDLPRETAESLQRCAWEAVEGG